MVVDRLAWVKWVQISSLNLLVLSAVVVLFACGLWGCQRGGTASAPLQESNIKPLAMFYGQFIAQNQGRPPADEAEFKRFIQSRGPAALQQFGVSDVESLFISTRDNLPYKVAYGGAQGPPNLVGQPVVVYEQQGVGGKRYVANTLGAVEEVDEARFKELVPNP